MYINDPLISHSKLESKWSTEFLAAITDAQENINSISIPAYIFHGTLDQIVPIAASELIFGNIASTDKTFEVSDRVMSLELIYYFHVSLLMVIFMKFFMTKGKKRHVAKYETGLSHTYDMFIHNESTLVRYSSSFKYCWEGLLCLIRSQFKLTPVSFTSRVSVGSK